MGQQRAISRANGFVHDVEKLGDLSVEPVHIRVLSDRSLYILQNLAELDVAFLSRYGQIIGNGQYLPVLEEDEILFGVVNDTVDTVRKDIMTDVNEGLLAIANAIVNLANSQGDCDTCQVAQCGSGGATGTAGQATTVTDDGVTNPNPVLFPGYEEYDVFKCDLAEYIVEQIQADVDKLLDLNWSAITFYGVLELVAIIAATVATPIFGDEILAVVGSIALVSGAMNGPLGELDTALTNVSSGIICALYTAPDVQTAKANAKTAIFQELESLTSGVTLFVAKQMAAMFLSFASLNRLFEGDETKVYPTSAFDCSTCFGDSLSWLFTTGLDSWTLTDNSAGGDSDASGFWEDENKAVRSIMHVDNVALASSVATWRQTAFTPFAVTGARLSFTHSGPSDSVITRFTARIIYTDASVDEQDMETAEYGAFGAQIHTVTLITATAKTIDHIEVEIARSHSLNPEPEWDWDCDFDNVLLEW
jgi:hypothetical protein